MFSHLDSDKMNPHTECILLVEENICNRLLFAAQLHRLGYQFEIATSSKDALLMIQDKSFSMILVNTSLQYRDGFEITAELRRYESLNAIKPTPVIGITASDTYELQEKCLISGMNDVVYMPVRLDDLRLVIATWLGSYTNDTEDAYPLGEFATF